MHVKVKFKVFNGKLLLQLRFIRQLFDMNMRYRYKSKGKFKSCVFACCSEQSIEQLSLIGTVQFSVPYIVCIGTKFLRKNGGKVL